MIHREPEHGDLGCHGGQGRSSASLHSDALALTIAAGILLALLLTLWICK